MTEPQPSLGVALRAVLISRGGLFLFAWLALLISPLVMRPGIWAAFPDLPSLDGWARWDSNWYWTIADRGYFLEPSAPPNLVFFPLYPLLTWFLSLPLRIGLSDQRAFCVAGIVLSQIGFAAAAVGLVELGRDLVGAPATRRAVWLFCLFPFSLFFSAVYSESLFVALAVWAFVAARRERWWLASALAALCAVTRIPGFAVGLGIAVEYLRARRYRWRAIDRGAQALVCMPLLLAIHMGYLWSRFGNPLVVIPRVQRAYWGRRFGVSQFADAWRAMLHDGGFEGYLSAWYLGLTALTVALVIPVWRRLGAGYACFVVVSLVMTVGTGLESTGRYISVLFPLFLLGGLALTRRVFVGTCVVFAANLAVFTFQFAHWGHMT